MGESNYHFTITDDVLCIVDEGPHDHFVTVTNNAENVLDEIKEQLDHFGKLFPEIIVYLDSDGMWDGMEYKDGQVEFYLLQQSFKEDAVKIATERFIEKKDSNHEYRST